MNGWLRQGICVVAALLMACAVMGCSREKPKEVREVKRDSRERVSRWRQSATRDATARAPAVQRRTGEAAADTGGAPPNDIFAESEGSPDASAEDDGDDGTGADERGEKVTDDGLVE